MTLTDDFSLKSWLRTLRYTVEYYDDTCEISRECVKDSPAVRNMYIGEKGKEESGDELYANLWECSASLSTEKTFENSFESADSSSLLSNYEDLSSRRSSCTESYRTAFQSTPVPEVTKITDLDDEIDISPDPIYQNVATFNKSATENIYENIPIKSTGPELNNSSEFEEEIHSTIQYLENVLDSIGSSDDDYEDNLTEDFCERHVLEDDDSVDFDIDDLCEQDNHIEEEKFTESSSSFGDFLRGEQLKPDTHQRFVKDNRITVFLEEPEPISPQEVKDIPLPKKTNNVKTWQRFSFPSDTQREIVIRPQSFPVFYKSKSPSQSDDWKCNNNENGCDCHFVKRKLKEGDFNLCFAKESRVSTIFEVKTEELFHLEVAEEKIFGNDLILRLKENAITWMTFLMEECIEEQGSIMEEKELLKSVSQHENEALSSTLKKFPVDDVTLRQDSIQANRRSKTVDYSIQGKPILTALPNRSFEIKGVVTIQSSDGLKQIVNRGTDWIQYQNQELWMVTGKKHKKHLRSDVHIDKINYVKDSKEVTLTTVNNVIYTLIFSSAKEARQFSDKYRTPVSAVKNMLLKFLGKRKSREYLEQKGIYKDEPIFGNTLEGICKNTGEPVPVFILNIIDLIEKPENIKSLGLYRTSGNLATIQKIRLQVDKGNLDILNDYPKDPDVLTGTLKLFFRELKEPLIPYQVCERLPDVMKLDLKQLTFKDHQKIKNTLTQYLSEANYRTFSVLIQHFIVVVDNKEWNKMDSYNLAICWALSMISPSPSLNDTTTLQYTKDMVSLSHDATRLIDFLIGYFSMYPNELKNTRMGSVSEMFSPLNRQESKDSVESGDSSTKSYRKSKSTSSLSVDVVTKTAIDLIEAYSSPDREGLYKKPGNSDKINKIIKRLNKKKSHELVKYKNDVHEIAAALKKHLSESEKLVDVQTVEQLATVYEKATSSPELKTRENVMALIEQSPKKDTLLYLLRHLDKVASKQDIYHISKNDLIDIWTEVLNRDNRIHPSRKKFSNFLAIAIDVGNLPDVVPLTVNNNGNTQYTEVMKDLINHQERNRGSRYDNIDCGVIDNNEQTKL